MEFAGTSIYRLAFSVSYSKVVLQHDDVQMMPSAVCTPWSTPALH